MKDKELMKNGSGYYDETAYKAMTAAPKPGEIWTHAATGYHMLIIASLNGVCSTLRLTEVEREGCIPVTGRTLMFATPIMLGYSFESVLGQYVKTIKGEEFEKVKKGITKTLGLQDIKAYVQELQVSAADMLEEEKETDALRNERDALLDRVKALEGEKEKALKLANDIHDERIQTSIELGKEKAKSEFYREMYDALLDKVISARGGSVNE